MEQDLRPYLISFLVDMKKPSKPIGICTKVVMLNKTEPPSQMHCIASLDDVLAVEPVYSGHLWAKNIWPYKKGGHNKLANL